MSSLRPARLLVVALALGALLVAGCGSTDDDAAETTTSAAAKTTTTGGSGGGSSTTDDTTTTESTTTTDDGGGSGGGKGGDFCQAYDELESATAGLGNDTLAELRTGADKLVDEAHEAADVVPDEIEDEFTTLVGGLEQIQDLAKSATTVKGFRDAVDKIDATELDPAGDKVDDWHDDNC